MISFKNDYSEGAHPDILKAITENNAFQEEGYGLDRHTKAFHENLKKRIGSEDFDVHLISGGTQTNLLVISSFLRPHEACIAADSGHISTHETGAIEATGHKVVTIPSRDGKLAPEMIKPVLVYHHFEHMVKPKLVYISNTTEVGTVYSVKEMEALSRFCREQGLILYVDGARLGAAMTSGEGAPTLKDMARYADAFFIGGTKNGALFGEALVIVNHDLKEEFRFLVKQRGALLAKGWVTGIQFRELFKDNLYFDLAGHANEMAQYLAEGLKTLGCPFLVDSPSNQIFPILPDKVIEKLLEEFQFYIWEKAEKGFSAVRLITSWATEKTSVDLFLSRCRELLQKS